MKIVERQNVFMPARENLLDNRRPTGADVNAAQFEPPKRRDRADLLLSEFRPGAPELLVEDLQRFRRFVAIEMEERQVPIIMLAHEDAAVTPGVRMQGEEIDTFID